MSAVGLEGIDHAVQQAHIWINEVDKRLGWSEARSYRLLKAVLHAFRDDLQVNDSRNGRPLRRYPSVYTTNGGRRSGRIRTARRGFSRQDRTRFQATDQRS